MDEGNVPAGADEKEIERVKDILRTLAITIKTFNLYPKDNPVYQKMATEFFEKFSAFFEFRDELAVDVEQHSLLYKGNNVFQSEESADNIALLLFVDGIRGISFYRGITFEEVTDFIDILRFASRETNDDDDIVTLFWEKNIKNMGYTTVEDALDDSLAVEESLLAEGIDQKNVEETSVSGAFHSETAIRPVTIEHVTERLTDNELNTIKNEFTVLEDKSLLSSTVELFLEILSYENNTEVFPEIVLNLGKIIDLMMKDKDIKGATGILTFLRKNLLTSDPKQSEITENIICKAGSPGNLRILFGESAESEAISQYLLLLGKDSIPGMIQILGELQEMKQRKLLCEILAEFGKENIGAFSEALGDERWYLVRNIAMILGMTKEPAAVKYLESILGHPNMKVRREVVKALEGIKSEDTKNLFLIAVKDEDLTIRIRALKALRRFKDPALFRVLKENASVEELKKKTFEEKKELLEALAELGGADAFPVLADLFRKKGLLEKDEITEIRAGAAYGLALVNTPEALSLIERETGSRKDILREACIKALRESQQIGNVRK
jgi:HEAT repeat protein